MRAFHVAALALVLTALLLATTSYGAPGGTGAASHQMQASMDKMHRSLSMMKPTGNADRDFVMMMIPHHQGAIDMAKVELKYGKDPGIRKMAQKIITDQQKEIAEMQAWMKKPGHHMKMMK